MNIIELCRSRPVVVYAADAQSRRQIERALVLSDVMVIRSGGHGSLRKALAVYVALSMRNDQGVALLLEGGSVTGFRVERGDALYVGPAVAAGTADHARVAQALGRVTRDAQRWHAESVWAQVHPAQINAAVGSSVATFEGLSVGERFSLLPADSMAQARYEKTAERECCGVVDGEPVAPVCAVRGESNAVYHVGAEHDPIEVDGVLTTKCLLARIRELDVHVSPIGEVLGVISGELEGCCVAVDLASGEVRSSFQSMGVGMERFDLSRPEHAAFYPVIVRALSPGLEVVERQSSPSF